MKSIILCEGKTDLILLSYYLSKVAGWKSIDKREYKDYKSKLRSSINKFNTESNNQSYSWYFKDEDNILCIYATGSNDRLISGLEQVIDVNLNTSSDNFDKIVVVSDRDDKSVEKKIFSKILECFDENEIFFDSFINNTWNKSNSYTTFGLQEEKTIELLPLIIPFEESGTIETFLLNSRKSLDKVEKIIVEKGNLFIEELHNNHTVKSRYLNSRGVIPKIKLGVYFALISPNNTFEVGDKILTSIPWEEYKYIRQSFAELEKI